MEKRNRYKNRIRPVTIWRLTLSGALLLAAGVSFVLMRNDHVLQSNEIRTVEEQISDFDEEIEMWELRIAGVNDRQELSRRLRWVQSDLKDIDTARVVEIEPAGQAPAQTESNL